MSDPAPPLIPLLDAIKFIAERLNADESQRAEIAELIAMGENSMLPELATMFRAVSAERGFDWDELLAAVTLRCLHPGTRH